MQHDPIDASLVDFDVLADWMDDAGPAGGAFEERRAARRRHAEHPGPLRARRPRLRPAPAARGTCGPRATTALRREARVLARAGRHRRAAPRALIAACADEDVLGGAVFYLMEPVRRLQPADGAARAARRRRAGPAPDGPGRGRRARRARRGRPRGRRARRLRPARRASWSGRSAAGCRSWSPTTH